MARRSSAASPPRRTARSPTTSRPARASTAGRRRLLRRGRARLPRRRVPVPGRQRRRQGDRRADAPAVPDRRPPKGNKVGLIGVVTETTPSIVSAERRRRRDVHRRGRRGQQVRRGAPERRASQAIGVLRPRGRHPDGPAGAGPERLRRARPARSSTSTSAIDARGRPDRQRAHPLGLQLHAARTRPASRAWSPGRLLRQAGHRHPPHPGPDTGDVDRSATYAATNVPGHLRPPPTTRRRSRSSLLGGRAAVAGRRVVGQQTADLDRPFRGRRRRARRETALGNLSRTPSSRHGRRGPVVAFMNPGGLRTDLNCASTGPRPAGEVTYAEPSTSSHSATRSTPSADRCRTSKTSLEQQWAVRGAARPTFLQLSVSRASSSSYDPQPPFGRPRVDPTTILVGGKHLSTRRTSTGSWRTHSSSAEVTASPRFVSGRPAGATAVPVRTTWTPSTRTARGVAGVPVEAQPGRVRGPAEPVRRRRHGDEALRLIG